MLLPLIRILQLHRNYRLMFRSCFDGGTFSDWRELNIPSKNRQIQMALDTLSRQLVGSFIPTREFIRIPAYQTLRQAVISSSNHRTNTQFQFAIIESRRFSVPQQAFLVFVSPIDSAEQT
ncbi:MAG: hypothetical protein FJW36_18380 [Acidobacteria bacterium]|nr:hypothetical protein [Acidobacteriota bacterium]